ncbi:MAG: hypothetical protein GY906_24295 [bacterium]|nr:hypothetical protein [bacterium]
MRDDQKFVAERDLVSSDPETTIHSVPMGIKGVDELAARLYVEEWAKDNCDVNMVLEGKSGKLYPVMDLVHAFLDKMEAAVAKTDR